MRLLVVCTGNICRSPAAELLLRQALPGSVTVSSAGTAAVAGRSIDPSMSRLLEAGGLDVGGFRSRQLTQRMIRDSDLILTATVAHAEFVVEAEPAALRRTASLVQFARWAGEGALRSSGRGQQPTSLASELLRTRPLPTGPIGSDDIADPYGKPVDVFERCFGEIDAAVEGIAAVLGVTRDVRAR